MHDTEQGSTLSTPSRDGSSREHAPLPARSLQSGAWGKEGVWRVRDAEEEGGVGAAEVLRGTGFVGAVD